MELVLEKTTKEDQRIALDSVSKLNRSSKEIFGGEKGVKIKIVGERDYVTIPKKALSLLFNILNNMAEGKSITVIPSDSEITTQQAADLLKVSRPHLVNLLEEGEISFRKAGSHRRIELNDLIKYQSKLKENRKEKLNFLTKQAQKLNLGY
ncbi:MAG: excisionase family DNA-binding protein [Ginsengibacter sp.]